MLTIIKSQIALRNNRPFAWIWIPGKYLHGMTALLVLSLAFQRSDPSLRWKEIVEPAAGRFMHHLELHSFDHLDDEVHAWMQLAWRLTGEYFFLPGII